MSKYILDTNIISDLMNNNEKIKNRIQRLIIEGNDIAINCISYYEIKRGLIKQNKLNKSKIFEKICQDFEIFFLDETDILEKAATIWAQTQRSGKPIPDADILIAAIAKKNEAILIARDGHYDYINNFNYENWTE